MTEPEYRCWAEINREALRHNIEVVRQKVAAKVALLAVVKANAYGHGLIGVAKTLAQQVDLFGVANLEEAMALRQELQHPIVILGPALPSERKSIAQCGFIPSLSTLEEARDFARSASDQPVLVNVKFDTGMGRMGVLQKDGISVFKQISGLDGIRVHSISTHMPVSNEDEVFTRGQLNAFSRLVRQLRAEVPGDYKAHVLQSAGMFAFADEPFEIVRPGIVLYGISPLPEFQPKLRPVMTWKTRIVLIRDMPAGHGISYGRTFITPKRMRVATLSAGYADGYPRHLSNREACVLVRGKRCPLLGRVTMDLIMADISDVPETEVGDEVVLMGRQGSEEISCAELAERAGTITWEITTRVGQRVRRVLL
jgi:alanine racemase